ncbi:MAG: 50S ribosomal protein L11 methyltransferase [Lachnospiraceae bacterium]|nr:50S ribosomal protein L11 methyltransferase [Lachnospiraceae bacterium]
MKYNRYTIKTTTEAEDIIAAALDELGVEGVEIEDSVPLSEKDQAEMFVDIPPVYGEDDGSAYLSFYLDASPENSADNEALLRDIRNELESIKEYADIGEGTITVTELKDEDYLNNWKQFFHQFEIEDILFIPSWEDVPAGNGDRLVIHIDPGSAFGTGKHETTNMCIKALKKTVKKGDSILDIGTGSGILSIMAYKFGAERAVGTDLDVCAIDAVRDNMEANGLGDAGFELIIGNIIDDKEIQDEVGYEKYDVVAANILAEVLIKLIPVVKNHIKKGGTLILSGIIDDKEKTVSDVLKENGYEIREADHMGEWAALTAVYSG